MCVCHGVDLVYGSWPTSCLLACAVLGLLMKSHVLIIDVPSSRIQSKGFMEHLILINMHHLNSRCVGCSFHGPARYLVHVFDRGVCSRYFGRDENSWGRGVDLQVFWVNIVLASLKTKCRTTAGANCRKASLHRPMMSVDGKRSNPALLWSQNHLW